MERAQLECFLAIADLQSFTKAADVLHVSQPAVTHRIQALEDQLGVKLIYRTNKSVRLTPEGELFLPYVKEAWTTLEKGTRKLRESQRSAHEAVLFRFCEDELYSVLPKLVAHLDKARPEIPVHFIRGNPESNVRAVSEGSADVAFMIRGWFDEETTRGLSFTPLFDDPFCIAMRTDHPLASENGLSLESLKNQNIIVFDDPGYPNNQKTLTTYLEKHPGAFTIQHVRHMDEALFQIVSSSSVAAVPLHTFPNDRRTIVTPLEDGDILNVGLVTAQNEGSLVKSVVQEARKAFADYRALTATAQKTPEQAV